jgi:hypothetical protein
MSNNKKGVVRTPPISYSEVLRLRKEVADLRLTVATIGFRILFSRDVLEQAGNEVERRGRMTPQIVNDLKLQISILENIMKSILCIPQEAVTKYRAGYLTDEFATAVKATADGIAPILIIPTGTKSKSGKFTLN